MIDPIRTANGFQQRPYQPDQMDIQEADLTPQIRELVNYADKDKSAYIGNPMNVRQPSFSAAVNGIENGDYEGLEMLDFGALADGTPAVAFIDEDGQRQVIKMTTPQWLGAMEYRSKARTELQQRRDLAAKQEAFKPYFNSMAKQINAVNDPDIGGYLAAMYQMDPQLAMQQLGEFQRQQMKQDAETVVWRGKPVPVKFAEQAIKMEKEEYEQGERAFDAAMKAYADQPYAAPLIENIRSLRRKPTDYELPSTATLIDNLSFQNAGPLPLVSLFHAMTKPMMTPLPQPVTLPRLGQDGQYNLAEITNFLNNFNMVSQRLGWDRVDASNEVAMSAIVNALDIANNSQGILSKVAPPSERMVPAAAREATRYGGDQSQGGQESDSVSQIDSEIDSAVEIVRSSPSEDPRVTAQKILDIADNPSKYQQGYSFSNDRAAWDAIRRAAKAIRQLSNG